ncbi:hypothetical protein ScPMuIL_004398 [Solemya velum]
MCLSFGVCDTGFTCQEESHDIAECRPCSKDICYNSLNPPVDCRETCNNYRPRTGSQKAEQLTTPHTSDNRRQWLWFLLVPLVMISGGGFMCLIRQLKKKRYQKASTAMNPTTVDTPEQLIG